jgi:large subunit ribosomal protein L13
MITIDAQDKTLGRVASAAAKALLGKGAVTFAKNIVSQEKVEVVNASKVRISGDKARQKAYLRYSGYPGGQKSESYSQLTARKGQKEAIRQAVLGMLPKNRLQTPRMKMLTIKD